MKNNTLNQIHPLVIGISGISGAGKSTLINKLSEILNATSLFWDDFDEISKGPEDYGKWHESCINHDDWVYENLADTLRKLKAGQMVVCPATKKELRPTHYILFDAPHGYCHQATGKHIDFLICLDTPLDIALARRVLRDHQDHPIGEKIIEELKYYLLHSRAFFILTPEERICDLSIDGSLPIKEQCEIVLTALQEGGRAKNQANVDIKLQPLSNELKKQIYAGFSRHAIAMTGHDEKSEEEAFIANDESGSFVGVVIVELFWGALHVKYVFVEEEYRNRGVATKLMEQALAYGRDNQCPFAFVETMNFQALGFYQKMGFELEFTRPGYKHSTSYHYLRKNL